MSKRNSAAAKTAARERLRIEREREAKRAKTKRQIIVGLLGRRRTGRGRRHRLRRRPGQQARVTGTTSKRARSSVKPANTTGEDGTTVVIGKADAKKTLAMYEDPRCPICAQFEQTVGPTVDKEVAAGKYKSSTWAPRSSTTS